MWQSFERQFPYDIIHSIISFLPRESLEIFSLLNHDFNRDVNRILWRTVWMPVEEDVGLILEVCKAICRDPERAMCVRKLVYGVEKTLPPRQYYPPLIFGLPFQAVDDALSCLVNLEHLSIDGDMIARVSRRPYAFSFCGVLNSKSWPFRLKSFEVNCSVGGINDFLATQTSIRHLRIERTGRIIDVAWDPHDSMPLCLPFLTSISATIESIESIAPNRPVETITIFRPLSLRSTTIPTSPKILPSEEALNPLTLRHIAFRGRVPFSDIWNELRRFPLVYRITVSSEDYRSWVLSGFEGTDPNIILSHPIHLTENRGSADTADGGGERQLLADTSTRSARWLTLRRIDGKWVIERYHDSLPSHFEL